MIYKKWNYRNYQPLSLIYYPRSPITDSCNLITVIINYHRQLIARERSSDHRFGWTPRGRTAARSATTMFQSLCAKPRTYKQLAGKAGDKNETKDFREPKIRCRTGGRKKNVRVTSTAPALPIVQKKLYLRRGRRFGYVCARPRFGNNTVPWHSRHSNVRDRRISDALLEYINIGTWVSPRPVAKNDRRKPARRFWRYDRQRKVRADLFLAFLEHARRNFIVIRSIAPGDRQDRQERSSYPPPFLLSSYRVFMIAFF